ncbi:Uncharacterised protein [uncultured archaeon]|nr:Uncharacterised protein [uncultured archaeon]
MALRAPQNKTATAVVFVLVLLILVLHLRSTTSVIWYVILGMTAIAVLLYAFHGEFEIKGVSPSSNRKSPEEEIRNLIRHSRNLIPPKKKRELIFNLLKLIESQESVSFSYAATALGISEYLLEDFVATLEDKKIVTLYFTSKEDPIIRKGDEIRFRNLYNSLNPQAKEKEDLPILTEIQDRLKKARKSRQETKIPSEGETTTPTTKGIK